MNTLEVSPQDMITTNGNDNGNGNVNTATTMVEPGELNHYKQLLREFEELRSKAKETEVELEQLRVKLLRSEGSTSGFADYLCEKYSIGKEDTLDAETGVIIRKQSVPTT